MKVELAFNKTLSSIEYVRCRPPFLSGENNIFLQDCLLLGTIIVNPIMTQTWFHSLDFICGSKII
jgi:hypothetical protein